MRFLIVGAAGHAQEVGWSLREEQRLAGRTPELLFFDDFVPEGPLASGLGNVVGPVDRVREFIGDEQAVPVLGVGRPNLKMEIVSRLPECDGRWARVVHPAASVGPGNYFGEGCYVGPGAIVTVNVTIGRFVTINMHCQVAHDCAVEDFVSLHPNTHLGGNVVVEAGAELGTASTVIPGLRIGRRAVLGAGCTAVRSLAGHATYVGVPARVVRRNDGALVSDLGKEERVLSR